MPCKLISLLHNFFVVFLITFYSCGLQAAQLELTPLDQYVRAPDPNYSYSVADTVTGEFEGVSYKTFIINMVSQQWLTEREVNLPIWEHQLTVTVPETLASNIAFLYLTGGNNEQAMRIAAEDTDIRRAILTNTVVATLYGVPSQPLVFSDDDGRRRSEDSIIAYTWDKYLRTGQEKWPLRLPMTKAAVRAMDTVTDLLGSDQGGNETVDQFVVAGGSKRGWTTWTTAAVDNRVVAIAPIVIDMLNLEESFKHHFEVYGAYSLAVSDYVLNGNIAWLGTPEFKALMKIVEPFEYRERLQLPKFLLNSTGDEFFLPDSWQFYWDQLVGEKHLRYVPNSNHGMGGTDVGESLDAWYHAIVHNVQIPRYSWDVADDGTITVLSLERPSKVLLWQAFNSEDRNFMQAQIGRAYQSSPLSEVEPGVYKIKLAPPETGYTAYYIELEFESGMKFPFKFSTGTKIVPDVTEYEWTMSPASARE